MLVDLICECCQKPFQRKKGEHSRNLKKGRRIFCSLKCSGKVNIDNIPLEKRNKEEYKKYLVVGRPKDKYSPFRWHLNSSKRNSIKRGMLLEITLEDLKEKWEEQQGVCPYTGWVLKNLLDTNPSNQLPKTPDRASLDRIDSSIGYKKENIQFVSVMAQYAKNNFTEQEFLEFCQAVARNSLRKI